MKITTTNSNQLWVNCTQVCYKQWPRLAYFSHSRITVIKYSEAKTTTKKREKYRKMAWDMVIVLMVAFHVIPLELCIETSKNSSYVWEYY